MVGDSPECPISRCSTLPHVDVCARARGVAVGRHVGPLATLAGKAWPSGDNTRGQWPWHRPKPFVSRHYATATCRGRIRLPGGEGQLDLWGLKPGEARDFV